MCEAIGHVELSLYLSELIWLTQSEFNLSVDNLSFVSNSKFVHLSFEG